MTASREKLPLKLTGRPGRVTSEQIDNTLVLFKSVLNIGKLKLFRIIKG